MGLHAAVLGRMVISRTRLYCLRVVAVVVVLVVVAAVVVLLYGFALCLRVFRLCFLRFALALCCFFRSSLAKCLKLGAYLQAPLHGNFTGKRRPKSHPGVAFRKNGRLKAILVWLLNGHREDGLWTLWEGSRYPMRYVVPKSRSLPIRKAILTVVDVIVHLVLHERLLLQQSGLRVL